MTPKEKAEELVDRFLEVADSEFPHFVNLMHKIESKQCALIAVNEIMKANLKTGVDTDKMTMEYNYWQEVKQEIEEL